MLCATECNNDFSSDKIAEMEFKILEALDWEISIPSSYEISYYLIAISFRGHTENQSEVLLAKAKTLCKALLILSLIHI